MFHLPSAKRVRRNQLSSPASSPRSSPDPTLTDLLRARLRDEYTFTTAENNSANGDEDAAGSGEEETELRLFAGPSSSAPRAHRIRLSSPDAGGGEPSFLVKRPPSYYFADELDRKREAELQAAAVDGETVMDMSREPWPGCALPWKVTTITAAGLQKAVLVGHPKALVTVEEKAQKRTRKGKKSRIALRKKMQATKVKQDERNKAAKEKEEAEKEKRTRRNREKKVKKKAREKARKTAGADGGDTAEHADGSADVATE